ncbi:UNKNOWN [Stylonychia lemnae]|uniref:Cyclin-like domain-containing protein n=1 Tax=Stylonychia lemnae TaxID=5949 RepID=A0A078B9T4_STYLE|nr:UNKNOWN [Stylonychia lemnae]|eukprot:CDW90961.1 UNKNOWN [Stylonychia lemnae]
MGKSIISHQNGHPDIIPEKYRIQQIAVSEPKYSQYETKYTLKYYGRVQPNQCTLQSKRFARSPEQGTEIIQQGTIQPHQRYQTFHWMHGIAIKEGLSEEALQKSFCYMDVALSTLKFHPDNLSLIGISSLILAAKVDQKQIESHYFIQKVFKEIEQMEYFQNIQNPKSKIIKCEKGILNFCQWQALVVTPIEITKFLLFLTNASQDFTAILDETVEYILTMKMIYEMAGYRQSSVALASLTRVLENKQYLSFLEGVLELILEYNLNFNLDEVAECKTHFQGYESDQKISNSPIPNLSLIQEEDPNQVNNYQNYQINQSPDNQMQNKFSAGLLSTQSSNSLEFLQLSPFIMEEDLILNENFRMSQFMITESSGQVNLFFQEDLRAQCLNEKNCANDKYIIQESNQLDNKRTQNTLANSQGGFSSKQHHVTYYQTERDQTQTKAFCLKSKQIKKQKNEIQEIRKNSKVMSENDNNQNIQYQYQENSTQYLQSKDYMQGQQKSSERMLPRKISDLSRKKFQ